MREFKFYLPNGIALGSDLSESKISEMHEVNERNLGNGYVWYTLPSIEINAESIIFSLCFFQSKIQSLNISISNPNKYGSGWNDFSEAKEKLRAKDIEKWLSNLGFQVGKFSWGEIWAGYDSKGGYGHAVIRYAPL